MSGLLKRESDLDNVDVFDWFDRMFEDWTRPLPFRRPTILGWNWMTEDMDLNAGTILDGTETVEQVGMRIFEKIIAVASGEKTKSELAGMGDEEFAPWQLGPTF